MAYSNIDKPNQYFNTVLYTGTGASNSITGVGFQPDWVWLKRRDNVGRHRLFDAVRGATKSVRSDDAEAEITRADSLTSFDSDGFTLGSDSASGGINVNISGETMVGWSWLGANGTSANSDGSITSTVSANTTSGFSIVSYTGNATSGATVGHGLNQTPEFILTKNRIDGTSSWGGYHVGIDATAPEDYVIQLDGNGARIDVSTAWNDTAPTSSLVTLGNASYTNGSSQGIIMYCFHSVKGYSKFGTYTGNASTDGPFIYTGFKPAMVIVKASSVAGEAWALKDNKRNTFNSVTGTLFPDNTAAEDTTAGSNDADFLSNGFRITTADNNMNYSGATFIYMAFAESPLVGSNLVPNNAR